jgi:hypothetical protein
VARLELELLIRDGRQSEEMEEEEDRLGEQIEDTIEDHLSVCADDVACIDTSVQSVSEKSVK